MSEEDVRKVKKDSDTSDRKMKDVRNVRKNFEHFGHKEILKNQYFSGYVRNVRTKYNKDY